jgi:hypothetical protein
METFCNICTAMRNKRHHLCILNSVTIGVILGGGMEANDSSLHYFFLTKNIFLLATELNRGK